MLSLITKITQGALVLSTLYHEDHGATLKHKCGKRLVTLFLLSFSLIFLFFYLGLFLWPLFFRPESHPDFWGIIVSIILS